MRREQEAGGPADGGRSAYRAGSPTRRHGATPSTRSRWAWISHRDRHWEGLALMARQELADAQIIRFTRPAMVSRWLAALPACVHDPAIEP